jgi:hypothetical protein
MMQDEESRRILREEFANVCSILAAWLGLTPSSGKPLDLMPLFPEDAAHL